MGWMVIERVGAKQCDRRDFDRTCVGSDLGLWLRRFRLRWCTISVIYSVSKGGGDCLPERLGQQTEDRRIAEATETVDASLTQNTWVRGGGRSRGSNAEMLKCPWRPPTLLLPYRGTQPAKPPAQAASREGAESCTYLPSPRSSVHCKQTLATADSRQPAHAQTPRTSHPSSPGKLAGDFGHFHIAPFGNFRSPQTISSSPRPRAEPKLGLTRPGAIFGVVFTTTIAPN